MKKKERRMAMSYPECVAM